MKLVYTYVLIYIYIYIYIYIWSLRDRLSSSGFASVRASGPDFGLRQSLTRHRILYLGVQRGLGRPEN